MEFYVARDELDHVCRLALAMIRRGAMPARIRTLMGILAPSWTMEAILYAMQDKGWIEIIPAMETLSHLFKPTEHMSGIYSAPRTKGMAYLRITRAGSAIPDPVIHMGMGDLSALIEEVQEEDPLLRHYAAYTTVLILFIMGAGLVYVAMSGALPASNILFVLVTLSLMIIFHDAYHRITK